MATISFINHPPMREGEVVARARAPREWGYHIYELMRGNKYHIIVKFWSGYDDPARNRYIRSFNSMEEIAPYLLQQQEAGMEAEIPRWAALELLEGIGYCEEP